MNRRSFASICVLWLMLLTRLLAAGAVPNPKVIGPIPPKAPPGDLSHEYPFLSITEDLKSQGYVEEEFFLEGAANRYNTPPLATATVIDGGHPYRTRMVVRRPVSTAQFNGTVLLKWQNVTGGYDLDAMSTATQEHLIRHGYAWIGVSAQRAGVHDPTSGLKAWSPSRYRTLDLTHDGTIQDDALCYDVFSQNVSKKP
ncbi:MAG: hypothetical protein LAQ69_43325 [Acidobacteriia bacterium]|nr:hypothetical protein [Terriglobia bacterium]